VKAQDLQNSMKATSNNTVKAGYQKEIINLKKSIESTQKLIESDQKDRDGIK
jgi:hypothetical protein